MIRVVFPDIARGYIETHDYKYKDDGTYELKCFSTNSSGISFWFRTYDITYHKLVSNIIDAVFNKYIYTLHNKYEIARTYDIGVYAGTPKENLQAEEQLCDSIQSAISRAALSVRDAEELFLCSVQSK